MHFSLDEKSYGQEELVRSIEEWQAKMDSRFSDGAKETLFDLQYFGTGRSVATDTSLRRSLQIQMPD